MVSNVTYVNETKLKYFFLQSKQTVESTSGYCSPRFDIDSIILEYYIEIIHIFFSSRNYFQARIYGFPNNIKHSSLVTSSETRQSRIIFFVDNKPRFPTKKNNSVSGTGFQCDEVVLHHHHRLLDYH